VFLYHQLQKKNTLQLKLQKSEYTLCRPVHMGTESSSWVTLKSILEVHRDLQNLICDSTFSQVPLNLSFMVVFWNKPMKSQRGIHDRVWQRCVRSEDIARSMKIIRKTPLIDSIICFSQFEQNSFLLNNLSKYRSSLTWPFIFMN